MLAVMGRARLRRGVFDELTSLTDSVAGKEFLWASRDVILTMTQCTEADRQRVPGKVVGGGVGIVAASDYVIASRDQRRSFERALPSASVLRCRPRSSSTRSIGRIRANGASTPPGDDAQWGERHWTLRVGLASTSAELDQATDAFARHAAASNPDAIARIKRITWTDIEKWLRLLEEARGSGTPALSDYTRRAIAAFAARASR